MAIDWTTPLLEQLTWHWDQQLRPRLEGLTDEEYLWEPVPGTWNLRRRDEAVTALAAGAGDLVIDFDWPDPSPAPMTTIAWRIGHITVSVLGGRNHHHFGAPPVDYFSKVWPATAAEALAELDHEYATWVAAVAKLTPDDLAEPVGPSEGSWADAPMVGLVLHVHREVIHHGAEIALLRDLYVHR